MIKFDIKMIISLGVCELTLVYFRFFRPILLTLWFLAALICIVCVDFAAGRFKVPFCPIMWNGFELSGRFIHYMFDSGVPFRGFVVYMDVFVHNSHFYVFLYPFLCFIFAVVIGFA